MENNNNGNNGLLSILTRELRQKFCYPGGG